MGAWLCAYTGALAWRTSATRKEIFGARERTGSPRSPQMQDRETNEARDVVLHEPP